MYRNVSVNWKIQNTYHNYWVITTEKMNIEVQIHAKQRKIRKAVKLLKSKLDLTDDQVLDNVFLFILYFALFSFIEAPFSIIGNANDQELIYKAIWDGISTNEPELRNLVLLKKLEILDPMLKETIILNRLFLENNEFHWFDPKIILAPVILRNKKDPYQTNYFLVLDFINTCLYGTKKTVIDYYVRYKGNYYTRAKKILQLLLPTAGMIELPNIENVYFQDKTRYETTLNNYQKGMRRLFEGYERYAGIKILANALCEYINVYYTKNLSLSIFSTNNFIENLFNQFSSRMQSDLTKNILDYEQLLKDQNGQYDIFKIRAMHEFYKRNHPEVNISGIDDYDAYSLQSEKMTLRLVKTGVVNSIELEQTNLSYINEFQKRFGVPALIPLDKPNFLLQEYNFKDKRTNNTKYRKLLGKYDLPDVLEIYLDTTGSMYLQEDQNHQGFNDGSRRDIALSVLYGFLTAAKKAGLRENKNIFVRFHSFSETQVSTPLVALDKFFEDDNNVLRVIFSPNNGYEYENLNINMYTDDLKRLYIIITDGDLVIEGRTEREAKKIEKLLMSPLNQVILFEMRRQYSLGHAVEHIPKIRYYSVKNKHEMFQKGIEVI